jgi:hypothetical protein
MKPRVKSSVIIASSNGRRAGRRVLTMVIANMLTKSISKNQMLNLKSTR